MRGLLSCRSSATHSGSGLKHGKLKTGVRCACAGFFSSWSSAPLDIQPKTWRNENVSMLDNGHAQDFSPVDLQPLGIRPKTWWNKNFSMLPMRWVFLLWIFSNSGSGLKSGEIKTKYVAHEQDFSPVDLQPIGIRPNTWRIKNRSMMRMRRILLIQLIHFDLQLLGIPSKAWRKKALWNKNRRILRMRRIFLLFIFGHSGYGLKHGEIKNRSILHMRSTLLMWIFNYWGSCLKHGKLKTGVCCACTGFFSCWPW